MKRYICDSCHTQEPEQRCGLPPAGWLSVREIGGLDDRTGTHYPYGDDKHYCCPGCAITGLHPGMQAAATSEAAVQG
jgi:hypothetical protein